MLCKANLSSSGSAFVSGQLIQVFFFVSCLGVAAHRALQVWLESGGAALFVGEGGMMTSLQSRVRVVWFVT